MADDAPGAGLRLERLEDRMLLALTISQDVTSAGDILYSDPESITVNAGVVLQSTGGQVSLDAPSITILDGARLQAAGAVEVKATKTFADFPLAIWSDVLTILEAIKGAKATVDIRAGVQIVGSSLTIATTAGDDKVTDSNPWVGQGVGYFSGLVDALANLPVSVQIRQPEAAVKIGTGTQIVTTGDVSIAGTATANAKGKAIWSVAMDALVKRNGGQASQGWGVAAGFSYADATATVKLESNARIQAGGKVAIKSDVKSTSGMESRVTLNQGLQQTDPNNVEVAFAGASNKATSTVTIETGAAIVATKNVDVTASASDETTIKPRTDSYRDGRVGVVAGSATVNGTVEVIVKGSITAGHVIVPAARSFNPALAVDFAARAIDFPSSVEFRTGDELSYSPGDGGAIPGLVAGHTYFAIVDPAAPTRLRLAATAVDAALGRAVDFGAGYPTLTTPKGRLPIVSVDADGADTLWFGFDRWPDGAPLFADGQTVRYEPLPSQFLGRNDAAGSLLGPLPAGDYTVQLVPHAPGDVGMRIRLLDAAGTRIDLNANPQFVTEGGVIYQVASFDEDAAAVSFAEHVSLSNGQKIRYVQAFGTLVPGLVDGRDYFAVVDPRQPGVIQLADSVDQARAADPAVQDAVPTLETTESDLASRRTISIGNVQPGTGLVIGEDPRLAAGTPVTYHAVPGKPVAGLVDGVTYYAYPLDNPYFEPNFPQYVVGLRVAPDPATPLVDYELLQSLSAGDDDFVIDGIAVGAGALSLALPRRAGVVSADPAMLVGGTVEIATIPADSPQVWNNATGGTFTISLPAGDGRRQTAAIPFDATPDVVRQAINDLGLPGVAVTAAYGRGVYEAPWTLVGTGLDDLQFDWTNLAGGGAVWARLTREGLQAVSTTASGGTFTLALDAAGSQPATAPIPFDASATAVRTSLNGIAGVLTGRVSGSGAPNDPWLVEPRIQPLRTGDPVVFKDAWGSASPGLIDRQTYYVVVAPAGEQGSDDSVVVRLAATRAEAIASEPVLVPLSTTIAFDSPTRLVMAGTAQSITSTIGATGVNLAARLTSSDTQAAKSANGSQPGYVELLTRGDFLLTQPFTWKKYADNDWKENVQRSIDAKLGSQGGPQSNNLLSLSASMSGLVVNNKVSVLVDSTAELRASGAVNISSILTQNLASSVEATISKPTTGKYGVAVAVDVVKATNSSHATVAAGARVMGGQGVTVDARTKYPWEGELYKPFVDTHTTLSDIEDMFRNAFAILGRDWHKALVTHDSASSARLSGEGADQGRLEWSVAGNVSWVGISNDTVAQIEDGALINQESSIQPSGPQPVSVKADTTVSQVGFTGNPYLYRFVEGAKAIGGSVGYLEIANNTRALLGGMETDSAGTPRRTASGPLQVTAGSGGVNVNATNDTYVIQLTDAGDKATNFGFSGAASYLDAHSSSQVTEAAIDGPAAADRKAVVVSAGPVAVTAADSTYLIPIAGAVVLGDGKGVGVSTAIARLDRGVTARIGSKDDEPETKVGWVDMRAGGGLTTAASADGAVTPAALAGTVISQAKPAGEQQNVQDLEQPIQGLGNQPQGAFGLAVSGDFTWAEVDDAVRATVNTRGTITDTASSQRTLEVSARNTTVIQAIAGAAAILKTDGDGSSASLAGSAAIINTASTVLASVRRATLRGFVLDVSATNERPIGAQAASGSGAVQGRQNTGTSVQVAGSVTVTTITTTTTATVAGATAVDLGGLSVAAATRDTVWSAAGSFLANFSPAGGAAGGRCLGVGAAFARNHVTASTEATVVGSTLTVRGAASVAAVDASRLFTFAAGVIVVNAGSSLGGMFSFVIADSTVNAEIDGGSLDVDTGNLDVAATSALLIVTAAGDLVIGRGQGSSFAAGAACASVGGTLGTTARVGRGASVRVRKGNLSVSSRTRNPDADPAIDAILDDLYTPHREETAIWSFAIGVVWAQSSVTADFSVSVNTLTSTRSATIEDSATALIDDGSLAVRAADEAGIYSGAGAIAVGSGSTGKVAAGAAVVRNKLSGTTTARISSSTVTTGGTGTVDVSATGAGLIGTAAVGGDVAGKAALGTALVFNDIVQVVDARMTGTETSRTSVTANGAITVAATERSRIGAGAGQVSVATNGVGAGAAAAVNGISSTVAAVIERVTVSSSQGAIAVKADAAGEIDSYAMGVAGAFGGEIVQFAGVGSGTGNTLTRQVTAAVRSRSTLESNGLSVMATDTSKINSAAGTLAIQYSKNPEISVAVGISASTNTVGSTTDAAKRSFVEAVVSDSTVATHGSMEVSAKAQLAIQAITAAGALQFGGGGGRVFGIAGAGAGSGNTVQMDVSATVRDASVIQAAAGDVVVEADNETSVTAISGGVAVAGSSATSPGGVAVTLGAAAALNTVTLGTTAVVEGSASILSPGALSISACGGGAIKAVSFGVAAGLRRGDGYDLSGAGSAAVNTVTTNTIAALRSAAGRAPTIGSNAQQLRAITVKAGDTSSVVAGAGGLSSIFNFGKGVEVGLSVGVSFTINEVSGTVSAGIDGASVHSSGDVTVAADYAKGQDDQNIYSVTVAGAFDISAGVGVLFPLAGSGSRNTVAMTTSATISGIASVQSNGTLSVTASDTSQISSNAGGVGIGLTFGKLGGAVAVGAAYGKNEITNEVKARIEKATVGAGNGVTIAATATPSIESIGYGVAVSTSVADWFSGAAAGSGASAYNTFRNTVDAAILSSIVTTTSGDVAVTALDEPHITTQAGAGALAAVIGDGVALAPGVVVAESSVADAVTARIGRADGSNVDPVVTATIGTLAVQATSAAEVSSLSIAVAASAAIGNATGAFAGAGARGAVTFASTITAAIDAGTVRATDVTVAAVDRDQSKQNTIGTGGLAIGVVGGSIGVSLTETTAANTVSARIGAAGVTATTGGITVDVRGGHSLAAETVVTSVAVAIGGSGAGGHAFSTDTSTYRATVATGSRLTAQGGLVVRARGSSDDASAPDGRLDAQAHGGAGGLVAVGVVIAKATDRTRREATVGDGVDLSGVGSLGLFAASSPIVQARSTAVDVGGVAVTVNQSIVTTAGTAKAATGTGVTLPSGDVQVMASGSSRLDASQTGIVAGLLLAAGATQTTGESGLATEAVLGADTRTAADRTGSLVVRATSQDVTTIAATAGSGGLFNGFGTTGELSDTTTTRVTILGGTIHAGTVDLGVDRLNRYDLDVDSVTITIAAGVGITRAMFTADQKAADELDRVLVGIAADTVVAALDEVTVTAAHRVYRIGTDDTVRGVGGAVLVSGQQAVSNVSVQVPATIDVGDRAAITSGTNALSRPGGISFVPTASLEIKDSAALNNLGLLVSGGRMASYLEGGVTPQVTMGDDVRLVSHGQLNIGTSAFVQSSTAANGWGRGLFGGIGTEAASNVTVDQRVTIRDRAMFASDGSLSMTPGDEPTGGSPTSLSLTATARAADQGIVAVPVAKATTTLSHSSTLSVGRSADISSGGSMYLSARAAMPVVAATGEAQGDYFGFPKTDIDQHAESPTTSTVTLAGRFLAGRENALSLVIPAAPSGGFTDTVQATPATVFGVPVASTWRYLPTFDPTAYIDAAGYSPEVASALKAGVAPGTVGAVAFVSPQPIMVSGGSVAITADRIAADGATITARTATISIRNDSSDYLLLGDLAIANVEGGRVTFQNGGGHAVADPGGARIYRDDAAIPTIRVDVTSTMPVGDSTYGPAVFFAGHVENLGGDVTIRNASGSFGQTGTIAANRITIETPNGVFAVDTPNDPWNAAGTPAAQLWDKILWPGGDPRLGMADANKAVMYAINAMDAPAGTSDRGWKNAGNDDTLNYWVYGDPRSVRDTYVFFGGSTPQFENITNTQATSENWAAGGRPDGARQALKMTDAAPPHSHDWDHAFVPRLQALPSTFTTATLPSQSTGVAVTGQVIVINAKIANINGTLEAGGSKPTTQSVLIPKSLETRLEDYQTQYRLGTVSAPIYRIRTDELETLSPADRLIGASFDARTGQIILDEATSSGAGRVSIKGRIINTDALAGKIKVRGGSGDLVVTNDTSQPLVTANLQTSRAEKQAVVSITDLNVSDVTEQQIAYVYDGEQVLVYRGAAGVDLPALTAAREHVAGSRAIFQPEPNAHWQWQLEATTRRNVNTNLDRTGNWPGVDVSGWTFDTPDAPWRSPGGSGAGEIVFDANSNAFVQTMGARLTSWDVVKPTYQDAGWDTGFSDNHEFHYPASMQLTMTMSLKADWPIAVEFGETSFGVVRVTSVGDVVVGGGMVGSSVTIASSAGDVVTANGGFVNATQLRLVAATGIGSDSSGLAISVEDVTAATTTGGVFLDGRRGPATRPLGLRDLSAPIGTVMVAGAGDLRWLGGTLRAAAASLTSVSGGIGSLAVPVVVDAGPGGTLQLDASAATDIHVRQATGDMLVGAIVSSRGSVQLAADVNIYDADTWTIDPVAESQRLAALMALGATDPDAYKADVAAFERNVTSQYFLYWSLRTDGDTLSLWRPRTAAALGVPDPTDDQIRTYVAGLSTQVATFFTQTIGPSWQSLPQFQAFDAGYVYSATPAQVEQFRKDRTVTEAQLALQLRARALDAPPPGESVEGRVNITARNVWLSSARGGVGMNDPPVTISAAEFASGVLTPQQRQELALAANPGDARITSDGGLVLNVRRPIILAASGRVDVDAPAGIAIAQKTGSLLVGHVTSRNGLVSVIADGNILNAPATTIDMWGKPLDFERPADWSRVGNAGQSLSSEGGLFIPGYKQTASGTWLDQQVSTGSFKVSFVYQASANANPGDGLAFVLQKAGTAAVGEPGSGLGYRGITGPKVGFLINVYQPPGKFPPYSRGVLFDKNGTWTGGGFDPVVDGNTLREVPLTGQPVYVTLVYDAVMGTMTWTVADRPGPLVWPVKWDSGTVRDVDLAGVLGPSAFMGFTSGTGDSVTSQQVTEFTLASDEMLAGEHVTFVGRTFPDSERLPWVTQSSVAGEGFVLSEPAEGPTYTFPNQGNLAAAAWYPRPVRVSTDFRVTFRYFYDGGRTPGDGMALVFQNSPDGLAALGSTGAGLGYTGIPGKKVGYLINIYSPSELTRTTGTRFDTTGSAGGPYHLFSLPEGMWIDVMLSYDATAKTFRDVVTVAYDGHVTKLHDGITTGVNLPELLGGSTAILGVTASSGGCTATQQIRSLDFNSPPASPYPGVTKEWELNGGVQRLANGSLLIPAVTNTATSTWFGRPVSTDGFSASFTYEAIKDPSMDYADGLAFVLQRSDAGYAAIGRPGSDLGYLGMPGPKVGFLMNIYRTPGVRFDDGSEAGSFESVPWLTGGPVDVTLAYDAEARTFTARLSRAGHDPFSKTWTGIDLQRILGSQAIMGFTSGTGGAAATQIVRNFTFYDEGGIASFKPVTGTSPTVWLWSTHGDIGALGDDIRIVGRLEAEAPEGSIYTDPPPPPGVRLATVGGLRPNGTPVTNNRQLHVVPASSGHTIWYSIDRGRTWRSRFRPVEGLNDVLVMQIDGAGRRSDPRHLRFVLDRQPPAALGAAVQGLVGNMTRTGQLRLTGSERGASVQYSVNGSAWSSTYAPVEGRNVVRIRQVDLAGNISIPTVVRFVLKTRVAPLTVSLLHPEPDRTDAVTTDGRLVIRGREPGARIHYSTDGGRSWRLSFNPVPGVNRLVVRQVDLVGNRSEPTSLDFTFEPPVRGIRRAAAGWWRSSRL